MFHNAVEFAVLYPGEEAPRWASARRALTTTRRSRRCGGGSPSAAASPAVLFVSCLLDCRTELFVSETGFARGSVHGNVTVILRALLSRQPISCCRIMAWPLFLVQTKTATSFHPPPLWELQFRGDRFLLGSAARHLSPCRIWRMHCEIRCVTATSSNRNLTLRRRASSIRLGFMTARSMAVSSAIIIKPPTNSAATNSQPISTAMMMPSSGSRLLESNWKVIAAIKSAPLRKIVDRETEWQARNRCPL